MTMTHEKQIERYKAILTLAIGSLLAIVGFATSTVLDIVKYNRESEAKRIEYRVKFYHDVENDLNAIYTFVCRVGNYYLIAPNEAGSLKRKLDGAFVMNIPFMSAETYAAYQSFTRVFVRESKIEAEHFKFLVLSKDYGDAYKQHLYEYKRYMPRGGTTTSSAIQKVPEVSLLELCEWFTNEEPRDENAMKKAYANLLYQIGRDSGFGSAKLEASKLSCQCKDPRSPECNPEIGPLHRDRRDFGE